MNSTYTHNHNPTPISYTPNIVQKRTTKRILHITFHYGTASEVNYVFKKLGYNVELFMALKYNTIRITHDLAESIWRDNEAYFQSFDMIITSDTAALSYPFLLHLDILRPKLLIWICNRFNVGMTDGTGEPEYHNLIRKAVNHPKVTMVPYTRFETEWCSYHGMELTEPVITTIGRYHEPFIHSRTDMEKMFKPLSTSHQFRPDAETVFVPDYHDNRILLDIFKKHNISFAHGLYTDPYDLKKYKAVISFPDAVCKIFYMEAIQKGITVLIPSKEFLKYLILHIPGYFVTSKEAVGTLIDIDAFMHYFQCYDYPTCYGFFDSIEHLLELIPNVHSNSFSEAHAKCKDIIHDDIMSRWNTVLNKVLDIQ
jgi:hypothetical protein